MNAITRTMSLPVPLTGRRDGAAPRLLLPRGCSLGFLAVKHGFADRARQRKRRFEPGHQGHDHEEMEEIISRGGLSKRGPERRDRRSADIAEDQDISDEQPEE